MTRLDKYLAELSVGTRSEVKKIVRSKRVMVNGSLVSTPDIKINPEQDEVMVDGEVILYERYEYYMLYKPAGYVSATTDRKHKTVLDLIVSRRKDLFPVGRLDIDTEGLLLITNDGALSHHLLSPRHHVEKVYYLQADGEVTSEDVKILQDGVDIGDEKPTMPAKVSEVEIIGGKTTLKMTIQEGRYHQVKRMMAVVGKPVLYLKRLQMGELKLDETLRPGEYRTLTKEEVERLKK